MSSFSILKLSSFKRNFYKLVILDIFKLTDSLGDYLFSDKIYKLVFSLYDMKIEVDKKANSHFDFVIRNNILSKSKRSQGAIISVVLLILIVVASAVIVMAFVIPFVRDKLSSGDCLDVIGKVEISSSAYTCYEPDPDYEMHVQVGIGAVRDLISGFSVELGGASSQSFKLINGTTITDVTMYDGNVTIELPGDNEERTYIFNGILIRPNSIKVYPILKNGKACEASGVLSVVDNC